MLRYSLFQPDLSPAERLFAAVLKRAVRDVVNVRDERLNEDAMDFLLRVAPGVAQRATAMVEQRRARVG